MPPTFILCSNNTLFVELLTNHIRQRFPTAAIFSSTETEHEIPPQKAPFTIQLIDASSPAPDEEIPRSNSLRHGPVVISSATREYEVRRDAELGPSITHRLDGLSGLDRAIQSAMRGESYRSQAFEDYRRRLTKSPSSYQHILSDRELQVLQQFAKGRTDEEISRQHGTSPATVNCQRRTLMAKLDVHTAAELLRCAIGLGFPMD